MRLLIGLSTKICVILSLVVDEVVAFRLKLADVICATNGLQKKSIHDYKSVLSRVVLAKWRFESLMYVGPKGPNPLCSYPLQFVFIF
jgi:hypothetical protein